MTEICPICSNSFYIKPFHKKRFKGPFTCSRKCRGELLKKTYSGSKNPNFKFNSNIEKFFAIRTKDIKRRSKSKGIAFNIEKNYLFELYNKQEGKCYYTGIPMKLSTTDWKNYGQAEIDVVSVDKIIPKKGYIINNIVLCCNGINKLKGNTPIEEFQYFIKQLRRYKNGSTGS